MSDNNTPPNTGADATAEFNGYTPEPSSAPGATARKASDAEIRKRNFMATFGSGPGKLGLIAAAVVVVVFGALAYTSMKKGPVVASKSQVDAPSSPQNRVNTNEVTPEEAKRRAEQSRVEAEAAQQKGGSYQPGFDVNIGESAKHTPPQSTARFDGFDTPEEAQVRAQNAQLGSARTFQTSAPAPTLNAQGQPQQAQQTPQQQAEQQRREQENQRAADKLAAEQKTAEGERDRYVDSVSQEIVKQIGGMFSTQGSDSLNSLGAYSQTSYYTAPANGAARGGNGGASAARNVNRKPVIKAGTTMYATLDSEANTDDGRTILATIRSGKWKGSKLIGTLEQSYNNMSFTFTTLAPQDDRSTMRIRAVALREEDSKLGMAETIDHHTLSRYTALGAAALLQGAGRVYSQPVGTTVATNAGIVTTTEPPRDRQVIGAAFGELGTSVGAEIRRRGFNQPSTYATPADKGFTLYFLEDVAPANSDDQQSQQQQQQLPLTMQVNVTSPAAGMPPAGQGIGTGNPAYGQTPYGYAPGYTGTNPYQGVGTNPYQGSLNDNRYRGPLNSNY